MSATNHTTNYSLPQFIGTDVPTWLTDVNGAMSTIDTAIKAAKDAGDQGISDAGSVATRMTAAENTIGTHTSDITALQNADTSLQSSINANTTKIGSAALSTVSQNLSGAVNELYSAVTITEDIANVITVGSNTLVADEANQLGKTGIFAMMNLAVNPNGTITAGSWVNLLTLPESYRPASTVSFNCVIYGSGNSYITVCRGEITDTGSVRIHRSAAQGSISNAVRIAINATWLLN